MSVYRVVGPSKYRGHRPGDLFDLLRESRAEVRAIGRGSIEVVDKARHRPLDPAAISYQGGAR